MQLWMVALVFALLFALFLIVALMDLSRLEDMLLNHRIKKAEYVMEGIQLAAEGNYNQLMRDDQPAKLAPDAPAPTPKTAFSAEESLEGALISLAEDIGHREQMHNLSQEQLSRLADSENLSAVAVLDEKGEVVVQTGPLPDALKTPVRTLVEGRREEAIDLSVQAERPDSFGFAGIRRHGEKGAVILVLDAKGLRQWRLKAAVRKAAGDRPLIKGVTYFVVEDSLGRQLAMAGQIPEDMVRTAVPASRNVRGPENAAGRQVTAIDRTSIEISLPFRIHDETVGTAHVGLITPADQFVIEERRHIFLWTGFMILIGLIVMGLLYQTQNRHISRLQAIRERLQRAERHSSLARLAAGVAHEIRNPLNAISMATQRLQREYTPREDSNNRQEFERITFVVRDEIKRLNAIIQDFLSLSQSEQMELHPHPIGDLVERIVFLVRDEAQAMGIRIEEQGMDFSLSVLMDTRKMEQALFNIVRNAMESISGEGFIIISVDSPGKNRVSVRVRDTGAGIPREELGRIFDPFYTTKKNGTGIGLCIANEIIAAHGGEILVQSEPGRGTTFEILLPRETSR